MNKGFVTTAISALVLGLALGSTSQAAFENDRVLAKINGEEVKASDLMAFAKLKNPTVNLQDPTIRQQLITAYVGRELLYQEAIDKKMDQQDIVKVALKNQRREVVSQALIAEIIKQNPITEAELKAYYDKQVVAMADNEFNTSHILTKTESEAQAALARLNKGEDFASVAKAVSIDTNAQAGGLIGWMNTARLPEDFAAFADALKHTKAGDFSKTPVQTQFGWHIIKVNEVRAMTPPAFESVKPQLMNLLLEERVANHVAKLQEAAKIEILN